jgi:hypothetical protein
MFGCLTSKHSTQDALTCTASATQKCPIEPMLPSESMMRGQNGMSSDVPQAEEVEAEGKYLSRCHKFMPTVMACQCLHCFTMKMPDNSFFQTIQVVAA